MGVVMRGRDDALARDVAVKLLHAERAGADGAARRRFEREARIGALLEHPGVAPAFAASAGDAALPFLVLPLLEGSTLADRLRDGAPRDELLVVFERVAQTIAYAHDRGVVHRDLKPANVMVGAFGDVLVLDWGLAKLVGEVERGDAPSAAAAAAEEPPDASLAGDVLGTPGYMAPEQARGDVDAVGPPADVFALGSILCRILTGAPCFEGDTRERLDAARAGRTDAAIERLLASGESADLVDLTVRCLAVEPAARPRAADVAAGMARLLADASERAHRAEVAAVDAEARAAQERRLRRLARAIGALALVASAGGVFAAHAIGERGRRRDAATRALVADAVLDVSRLEARGAWAAAADALADLHRLALAREADAATLADVERRLGAARSARDAAEDRARRDARLAAAIAAVEDARLGLWADGTIPEDLVAGRLVPLLRDHGFDLEGAAPSGLGAAYRDCTHATDAAFLFALPAVRAHVKRPGDAAAGRVLDFAAALHPDPRWDALRRALASGSSLEVARFGQALLAAREATPFLTVAAIALAAGERRPEAVPLLRRANARNPQDVWGVQALSLPRRFPSLAPLGSARFGTALLALRPGSAKACAGLAAELARIGREEEARSYAARAEEMAVSNRRAPASGGPRSPR